MCGLTAVGTLAEQRLSTGREQRVSIFHLSAQIIGRSSGRSSTAAAAYRAGMRIVDERTGEVHDFTRKLGVRESFILAPDNAPAWMLDRAALWNGVEAVEKRKDAQLAREIEVALPHELPHEQRRSLLAAFVTEEFVNLGMIADVAMHAPGRDGDRRNEHAHVMLTLRQIDGTGFGQKAREWNDSVLVEQWRESWARRVNAALEEAAISERVDHRSYERQALAVGHDVGMANLGTVHLGPQANAAERRGVRTVPGDLNREVRVVNLELERVRRSAELVQQSRIVRFHPHGKGEIEMCVTVEFDLKAWRAEAEQYASERNALLLAVQAKFGTTSAAAARKEWEGTAPVRQPESGGLKLARQNLDYAISVSAKAKATQRDLQDRGTRIKPTVDAIRRVQNWRDKNRFLAILNDWRIWSDNEAQFPDRLLGKDGKLLPQESVFDRIDPAELLEEWTALVADNRKLEVEIMEIEERRTEAARRFNAPSLCSERERIECDYAQKHAEHASSALLLEQAEIIEYQQKESLSELDDFRAAVQRAKLQSPEEDEMAEAAARLVEPLLAEASQGLDSVARNFVARKIWSTSLEAQQQADELADVCDDECGTLPVGGGAVLTFKPSTAGNRNRLRP